MIDSSSGENRRLDCCAHDDWTSRMSIAASFGIAPPNVVADSDVLRVTPRALSFAALRRSKLSR